MVAIVPDLCLWQLSLCSNMGGIALEKLCRATLIEGDHLRGPLHRGLTVVTLFPKEELLSEQG